MSCRRGMLREMPISIEEVKVLMKQEKAKRGMLLGIVIGVVLALVAVVLWVARCKSKDLEEHYEYFDEEFEDEEFEEFDEDIYEDENTSQEGVEYVKIKDFMGYDEEASEEENETEEETSEEVSEDAKEEVASEESDSKEV